MEATLTWPLVEGKYTPHHPTPAATLALRRATSRTIKEVAPDIKYLGDEAAVAALVEFTRLMGQVRKAGDVDPTAWIEARDTLLVLLAPTAPHITEELWHRLGHPNSIHIQPFPLYDEDLARGE